MKPHPRDWLAPPDLWNGTPNETVQSLNRLLLLFAVGVPILVVLAVLVSKLNWPVFWLATATAVSVAVLTLRARLFRNLEYVRERARASERALVQANAILASVNRSLEQRVATRTQALEVAADVSRLLAKNLRQDELVQEVVQRLQDEFDYYHVHVYLSQGTGQPLRMVGGTGPIGRELLNSDHTIPWGEGLVGRAAESGLSVHIPDVRTEPAWLPNRLLPDTQTEISVPLRHGERILGVLDVQQNAKGSLTGDDLELLEALGNQIAIALENARLFEQTQAQVRQEQLVGVINERILATTSIDDALKVAVREVGRALNVTDAEVRLDRSLRPRHGGAE